MARLMVVRVEAAMLLGAAPQKSLKVADKSITGQEVKDAGTVAPVSDFSQSPRRESREKQARQPRDKGQVMRLFEPIATAFGVKVSA